MYIFKEHCQNPYQIIVNLIYKISHLYEEKKYSVNYREVDGVYRILKDDITHRRLLLIGCGLGLRRILKLLQNFN